jgi:diguanylate cyclase (GGDEF)-like protein
MTSASAEERRLIAMPQFLPTDRLMAIIATQDEIARSDLDAEAVMQTVVRRAMEVTGAAASVVELVEGEEMVYQVCAGTAADHVGLRLKAATSLSGLCARQKKALHCRNAGGDDRVDYEACQRVGAISMVCVPLHHRDDVVAVLKVYDPVPYKFTDEDVRTLELLSGVIASQMAHARLLEEHRYGSHHDALTGLANRRAFEERLEAELARARRHGSGFAVVMIDLDGFKAINDTLGHGAGDAVLRGVAANLVRIRREDDAFRIGGDEFAMVLIEAPDSAASTAMARLQDAVKADQACRGVGLSWGISDHREGDDVETLTARADERLYEAKRRAQTARAAAAAGRSRRSLHLP